MTVPNWQPTAYRNQHDHAQLTVERSSLTGQWKWDVLVDGSFLTGGETSATDAMLAAEDAYARHLHESVA